MFQRIRGTLWRIRHLVIALTAIVCLLSVLQAGASLKPATRAVVVAAESIPAGKLLEESDLETAHVPEDLIPTGTMTAIDEAAGEVLVSGLPKGMPLPTSLLLSSEFLDSAPPGYSITSVTIIADGTEGMATPGTSVALYAPPSDLDETAEAVKVVDDAIVVGHGTVAEGGSFLSNADDVRVLFLAIPEDTVNLVLGYSTRTAMRIVLNTA
ncbi:MAG: SAF domain-containing protein [Ancrocorticia sp.]|uniref:SAF domain-containing protein n=1 Tax=Ancrocorticia sp. TaxID=2593684 RepID=UPI003F91DD5A